MDQHSIQTLTQILQNFYENYYYDTTHQNINTTKPITDGGDCIELTRTLLNEIQDEFPKVKFNYDSKHFFS